MPGEDDFPDDAADAARPRRRGDQIKLKATADLPVRLPTHFDLATNLRSAADFSIIAPSLRVPLAVGMAAGPEAMGYETTLDPRGVGNVQC